MTAAATPASRAGFLDDVYSDLGLPAPSKGKVAAAGASSSNKPAGSWVVVLKDGTDPDAVANAVGASPKQRYTDALSGFAADLTEAQLQKLDRDNRVLSLNENRVLARPEPIQIAPMATSDFATAEAIPPGHPTPQVSPAGIQRVGTLDSPTANIDGNHDSMNVDIAVLDSGVFNHPDLNLAGGVDCHAGDGFDDVSGHGTLVAGIAAAKDNAFGVVGVAPGARVWAIRIEDPDGTITEANVLCGIDSVRRLKKIEVANLSFSTEGFDRGNCGVRRGLLGVIAVKLNLSFLLKKLEVLDPVHLAVCGIVKAGVTVVAAAGNESVDAAGRTPPAYPEVITVSAFADFDGTPGGSGPGPSCFSGAGEQDDTFASFSNFGKVVDISAPGVCVLTTSATLLYSRVTGTSFAAPHVAGAAALLKVRHPHWSPAKIRQHILATAEPGPIFGDPDTSPEGVLNVRGY